MRTHAQVFEKFMDNPEFVEEYEALRPHYEIVAQVICARNEQGLTQEALAERTGIQRSNISRLESGNYNPSVDFLTRIAQGLGLELHIEFREPAIAKGKTND
ncbi:MAG: helix-turn-helix transcriptional regulator [Oscillospiraceae bacterium]|jgi:DNA-binding XRE family transcriptional regulator|nr:helix-turn-helix transcriptional regulator [Oscillospiraceae bacterium]